MPRGAQLLAAARRVDRDVEANVSEDSRVILSQQVGHITSVLNWEALAASQPQLSDSVLSWASAGESFALEDRNVMSAPWRRVFIVRDKGSNDYVLFDEKGRLIDEPLDGGVPAGRQTVDQLVSEFSVDGFYYKPPSLGRPSPAKRKRTAAAIDNGTIVESHSLTPLQSAMAESNAHADSLSAAAAGASPQCENALVSTSASEEQHATQPAPEPLTQPTEVHAIATDHVDAVMNVAELLCSIEACAGDASQSEGIESDGGQLKDCVDPQALEDLADRICSTGCGLPPQLQRSPPAAAEVC